MGYPHFEHLFVFMLPTIQLEIISVPNQDEQPIEWQMTWHLVGPSSAAPPSDSLLDSLDTKPQVDLFRHGMTIPIDRPDSGEPFAWASSLIKAGVINQAAEVNKGPQRSVSGTLMRPKNLFTVYSCGLQIEVCRFISFK